MKNFSELAAVLFLSLPMSLLAGQSEPSGQTREYRPLAAKAVRVVVAGKAMEPGDAAANVRKGWGHFDRAEWEQAMDAFLSALEQDATNAAAAEGLTMSVYRSGDRRSAAKIAEELSDAMPWIRGMIAETVQGDIRAVLERGELALAEDLIDQLPYGEGAYDRSRQMVEAATAMRAEEAKTAVATVATVGE